MRRTKNAWETAFKGKFGIGSLNGDNGISNTTFIATGGTDSTVHNTTSPDDNNVHNITINIQTRVRGEVFNFTGDSPDFLETFDWTYSEGVGMTSSGFGTAPILLSTTSPLTIGETYTITFVLSGATKGWITLDDEAELLYDGTYERTFVASSEKVFFTTIDSRGYWNGTLESCVVQSA
jgi:hypothetical protein